ncbi:pyridoxamine 5'-phosphate oxidase family protein [Longispora albida]|uniref:pyridoxamine 5'-phosphate oxidase family protein n=1 Tax=Longispora albida TaxID=203523 RepID=UPI00035F5230|nr:pyridoxamine 5'-phosphate oxidase family protein [Longispora albida]
MGDARQILEDYVSGAKVMQLATVTEDGSPVVCNVWFASTLSPDKLYFISRPAREHSANIRRDGRVAGSILDIELDELGQEVRGVTYTGTARELPATGVDTEIGVFAGRWPRAARAIDAARMAAGTNHHRIYEVTVTGWILFDEENFADQPRQPVPVED